MLATMSEASSVSDARFRLKGAAWLGVALFGGRLAQAIAFFVMARYLDASSMGAVAILNVLYLGLFQLTNLGFERYIVYARSDDEDSIFATVDAVWTMQLLRGLSVLLLVLPLTFALSHFSNLEIGVGHTAGIAIAIFVLSLVNPALSTFERSGNFSVISRSRGLSALVGALSTGVLVSIWPSPWAFVFGQLSNAVALALLSFHYCRYRPRVVFNVERLREVFAYGKHMVVIATVSFLSAQGQNVYIGVMSGAAVLGYYFTWNRLVGLPGELVTQLQDRLLFAKASELARRKEQAEHSHITGFALTMGVLLPFYSFVWFHGDILMSLVAGSRWVPYWWVGRAFVFIGLCNAVGGTITPFALVAVPHLISRLRSLEAICGFALMIFLGRLYGIEGVLAALMAELSVVTIISIVVFYRYILRQDRMWHARKALMVVVFVLGPLLLWEALVSPLLSTRFASAAMATAGYLTLAFYFITVSLQWRKNLL